MIIACLNAAWWSCGREASGGHNSDESSRLCDIDIKSVQFVTVNVGGSPRQRNRLCGPIYMIYVQLWLSLLTDFQPISIFPPHSPQQLQSLSKWVIHNLLSQQQHDQSLQNHRRVWEPRNVVNACYEDTMIWVSNKPHKQHIPISLSMYQFQAIHEANVI